MTKPLLILLLTFVLLFAQGSHDWQSITNLNNVTDITFTQGAIWAVSDGGMFRYNIQDSSFQKFTNLQGLRSLDLTTIANDTQGLIIVGGNDGIIQIYDPQNDTWDYHYSMEGNPVYDVVIHGDTLWVATQGGVGVLVRNQGKYIFKDFFHNFPIRPEKVLTCAVFNGKIWLGTDKGLLSAPSNFGRFPINDPRRWKVFTTSQQLPGNYVSALAVDNQFLWVGTKTGLASVDKQNNVLLRTNWKLLENGNYLYVDHLLAREGTLYVSAGISLFTYKPATGTALVKVFISNIQSMAYDSEKNVWVGLKEKGIASFKDPYPKQISGPATNLLRNVYKDKQNNLWLSGSRPKTSSLTGILKYDGSKWTQYYFVGRYWSPLNDVDVIYQDRFNNMWFASWGGGAVAIKPNADTLYFHTHEFSGKVVIRTDGSQKIININPSLIYKNFFSGAVIDHNYEVITSITEDPNGRLWFANYYASNDHLLAVAPYDAQGFPVLDPQKWIYFGSNDGIKAVEGGVLSLAFDTFSNRVYIGTYRDGVYVLDYGNSLADKSDDKIYHLQVQDNLFSNFIQSLAVDQDDILWIGTAAGLNSFDGINVYKHVGDEMGLAGPLENDIRKIVVDKYNNKWFATSGGVSILRADRSPWDSKGWIGFNTKNSYLVNNNVQGMYVDNENGEAYFATEDGLSIYRGSFAEIRNKFSQTVVGPNPYFVDNSGVKFVIKNLMLNSSVKIFTINGKLVRRLTPKTLLNDGSLAVDGGRAYWDGRDMFGKKVASGIYLYLVYTEEGKSTVGKFAVIRR